jgi:DNA-binding GntR family transcriptional regulator
MEGLRYLINLGQQAEAASRVDTHEQALPEHLQILDDLLIRDVDVAKNAMCNHLRSILHRTLGRWPQNQQGE